MIGGFCHGKHLPFRYIGQHKYQIASSNQVSIPYGLTLLSNHRLKSNIRHKVSIPYGLTLLSNLDLVAILQQLVSIPYGLTLLSNLSAVLMISQAVSIPYGLTLLSNLKFEKTTCISLYYSLGNFILNYISHKSRSMIKRLSFAILSYSLFSKKIT